MLMYHAVMAEAKTYKKRFQDKTKAEKYSKRFEKGAHKTIDRREQAAVWKIFSTLDHCRTVLDVPSGAGRFAAALAQGKRKVYESDVAFEILECARKRAKSKEVAAQFVQGDASKLPFRNGGVDCVFCNRLLHHILSPDERLVFLRELYRVSRRYVVISFFDYHSFGFVRRTLKALKGRKPKYAQEPTFEQFQAELTKANLKILTVVPTGPVWVAEKYLVLEKS